MTKDNNLNDLIIDDIKPERNRGKGILTIIALLIALLIVAIVMTRLFLGESAQNATTMEQKQEDMISPELRLDVSNQDIEADKKELEQLSSMIKETLIDKPADPTKSETIQIDEAAQPTTAASKPAETKKVPVQESLKKPSAKASQKAVPTVTKKITAPVKAVAAKPVHRPAPRKPKASSGSYYIQVGSFSKQPDKRFLSKITKNGFHYRLIKGKLLIGPYNSDATARRDLPRVKSKIKNGAFVKHL